MTAESSSDQSLNPAPSKGAAADQWRPEARRRALAGPQQEVLQSVRNRLSPASQTWEDQSLFLLQSTVQQHGGHLDTNFVQKGKRAPQIVLSCVTSCEAGILDWFLLKEPEWQGPESSDLANYEDKASRLFRNEKLILRAIHLKCQLLTACERQKDDKCMFFCNIFQHKEYILSNR